MISILLKCLKESRLQLIIFLFFIVSEKYVIYKSLKNFNTKFEVKYLLLFNPDSEVGKLIYKIKFSGKPFLRFKLMYESTIMSNYNELFHVHLIEFLIMIVFKI